MNKPEFSFHECTCIAAKVRELLWDHGLAESVIITGSLRRYGNITGSRPNVHDVDIVYTDKRAGMSTNGFVTTKLATLLAEEGVLPVEIIKKGDVIGQLKVQGIPVDLFRSDLSALPSMVMMRTGSQQHNIRIAATAKRMGYKWEYARGIIDIATDQVLAPVNWSTVEEGEKEIYRVLGLRYITPQERSL